MIQPFKNRSLDSSKPVEVYRCLNRKGHIYSIRQNQKVIGHTDSLNVRDVAFVVNKSGKKRAILSQQRNVHAFIRGFITQETLSASQPLKYCPFSTKGFMISGQEVKSCTSVSITPGGIYAD